MDALSKYKEASLHCHKALKRRYLDIARSLDCLGQWSVMSTPDAKTSTHGEKREEESIPQSVKERVKKTSWCPVLWASEAYIQVDE